MDPETATEYADAFRLSDVVPTKLAPAPMLFVKMSRLIFAVHNETTTATKRQLIVIFEIAMFSIWIKFSCGLLDVLTCRKWNLFEESHTMITSICIHNEMALNSKCLTFLFDQPVYIFRRIFIYLYSVCEIIYLFFLTSANRFYVFNFLFLR